MKNPIREVLNLLKSDSPYDEYVAPKFSNIENKYQEKANKLRQAKPATVFKSYILPLMASSLVLTAGAYGYDELKKYDDFSDTIRPLVASGVRGEGISRENDSETNIKAHNTINEAIKALYDPWLVDQLQESIDQHGATETNLQLSEKAYCNLDKTDLKIIEAVRKTVEEGGSRSVGYALLGVDLTVILLGIRAGLRTPKMLQRRANKVQIRANRLSKGGRTI